MDVSSKMPVSSCDRLRRGAGFRCSGVVSQAPLPDDIPVGDKFDVGQTVLVCIRYGYDIVLLWTPAYCSRHYEERPSPSSGLPGRYDRLDGIVGNME
jgi:hypothetical protein